MLLDFDYPITRPYPWRLTTLWIIILSSISFTLIVYSNLAVVGTTTTSTLSPIFQEAKSPSWTDRLNIKKTLNSNIGCDPTTLVAGGSYRTPNGAFTYTIRDFVDAQTRGSFSSVNYNSSSLNNCAIQSMKMFANFISMDAEFEAAVNCSLSGAIEMIATASSLVTLRTDTDSSIMARFEDELLRPKTSATYIAPSNSVLLAAFGLDFINQFLVNVPTTSSGTAFSTVYSSLFINSDMKISHFGGTWSTPGNLLEGPALSKFFSNDSMAVYENYVNVFWSAVLSDIGVSARPNILTDITLFNQTIKSGIRVPQGITFSWINGTAADWVLSHSQKFGLPYNQVSPTFFNARYLCQNITWKTPTSLVVDVLVATTSFFMLFWGALHVVLRYFATSSSLHGRLPRVAHWDSHTDKYGKATTARAGPASNLLQALVIMFPFKGFPPQAPSLHTLFYLSNRQMHKQLESDFLIPVIKQVGKNDASTPL
ncbi:hypothetical protein RhiLY_01478 [Ceratobasidium sp. AG-Ba]|nr:hypothetical protein RhiLY_01478 [Ceratobasidium sp. AG-Ba]